MRHSPSRRRSGFTFIEMLTVFVVLAAAMMISVRAIGDTLRRDRVAKVSAILGSDLEQAFAIAARLREPVRIIVDTSWATRRIKFQDRKVPPLVPTVYKIRMLDSTSTYALDALTTNRDTIDIMPNGLATDSLKLTLIIKTTGGQLYTKTVWSSKAGLVKVNGR
jgi:Tfp pilus assembly protein FimT